MSNVHIFSLPVAQSSNQSTSLLSRKRKRRSARDSDSDEETQREPSAAASDASQDSDDSSRTPDPDFHWASLTAAQTNAYRTAGFDPSRRSLPPGPFPHQRISRHRKDADIISSKAPAPTEVISALRKLNPPVFNHHLYDLSLQAGGEKGTLRTKHLANLTTLLHRLLSQGDYARAEKTWALLLRGGPETGELKNSIMDVRQGGKWALGAEILLQRGRDPRSATSASQEPWNRFQLSSVRAARQFYERLTVQYPPQKARHEQPTDFYLHMYTLWMYEVTEVAKGELRRIQQRQYEGDVNESRDSVDSGSDPGAGADLSAARTAIREQELQSARTIISGLEETLTRPPFDKSPDLLHLRGMLSLWLIDLLRGQATSAMRSMDQHTRSVYERQIETQLRDEHEKARVYFIRCTANGGRVDTDVIDSFNQPISIVTVTRGKTVSRGRQEEGSGSDDSTNDSDGGEDSRDLAGRLDQRSEQEESEEDYAAAEQTFRPAARSESPEFGYG